MRVLCIQVIRSTRLVCYREEPMSDTSLASPDVLARARGIKLFLMDVDGTLTDGGVCLISTTGPGADLSGVLEMKVFNAQDGQGLSLAHTMGIKTGFITGRRSPAVAKRIQELNVTFVYLGQATKTGAFEECVRKPALLKRKWHTWATICRTYRWRNARPCRFRG